MSRVAITVVDVFELAAINDHHRLGNRLSWRQSATNLRQTLRMALPVSRRKSTMDLKSGASRLDSHISLRLRWHSRSKRRLDWMRLS
ncbi:hypothetical protein FQZ97_529450 [compost metagenome]